MSKDGCPESPAMGWKTGYINITTKQPFDDPTSFPETSRNVIRNFKLDVIENIILGPFNRYNLQLNFCFKSAEHGMNKENNWMHGSYGLFGVSEKCPYGKLSQLLLIIVEYNYLLFFYIFIAFM
jgi:hypothetical protein